MIILKKLDNIIIDSKKQDLDILIHSCNCFCDFNDSVLSRNIRKEFPEAYQADCKTIRGSIYKLGEYSRHYYKNDEFAIINLYTHFKPNGNFEYTAFALALRNLNQTLKGHEIIGLPFMGISNGCNPEIFLEILKHELGDALIRLYKA